MFERDSGAEDRSFLKRIPFEYLVLDEAHCIKNSQSSRYLNLRGLNPRRRLLLSGTPVQNDVRELLALLSFLMPKVFKMEYIDFLYDSFMDRFIDTSKKSGKTNGLSSKRNSSDDQTGDVGTDVDKAAQMDRHVSSLHELRCMLAPFVLRRLKCDVLRQMPPKIGTFLMLLFLTC
jgi:SWI/SNF-related matrix-associated actin-dependent regulator 1 of chromatin subfamily A